MSTITSLLEAINHTEPTLAEQFGVSVIIAPHPDDETLGCGGTAALLCKSHIPVHFVFVSDGSMSHPNSKKYTAPVLTALRENEAIKAVEILGGSSACTHFLKLKDSMLPSNNDHGFTQAVSCMAELLNSIRPDSVFVPWRHDPHNDHRATYQIVMESIGLYETTKPRILEYPVWLWERGNPNDLEGMENMKKWVVDIQGTLNIKKLALAAHASQVTRLIDDDPSGFMLSPEVIEHFNIPRELFFESITEN